MSVQANQNSWERRETEAGKIKMPREKEERGWGKKGNDAVNGQDVIDGQVGKKQI